MSASIYISNSAEPDDRMLHNDLGETKPFLDSIASFIKNEYGGLTMQWKCYGKKSGWVLKMLHNNRNLLFIIPCHGYFMTVFTFGDKAVDELLKTGVSQIIKHLFTTAKKYAEGRTVHIDVKTANDLHDILELIKIKLI